MDSERFVDKSNHELERFLLDLRFSHKNDVFHYQSVLKGTTIRCA